MDSWSKETSDKDELCSSLELLLSSEKEAYALEEIDEIFNEGKSECAEHTPHEKVADDGCVLHISLMSSEKFDSFFERRCEDNCYETTGDERAIGKVGP